MATIQEYSSVQEEPESNVLEKLLSKEDSKTGVKETLSEFISFRAQAENPTPEAGETSLLKTHSKRKRKQEEEEDGALLPLTEVFLRIVYPLSLCLSKNVTVGILKSLDFASAVQLNHGNKTIVFTDDSWASFKKYLPMIECYLANKVFGRKTNIKLAASDIEIDNVKLRGLQYVRIRDLSKHDCKIQLSLEEFYMLSSLTPAVERYMKQLKFAGHVVKDYLMDTIQKQPNLPLLYGPIDTSIYNRLPQEVQHYKEMHSLKMYFKDIKSCEQIEDEKTEDDKEHPEEEQDTKET